MQVISSRRNPSPAQTLAKSSKRLQKSSRKKFLEQVRERVFCCLNHLMIFLQVISRNLKVKAAEGASTSQKTVKLEAESNRTSFTREILLEEES